MSVTQPGGDSAGFGLGAQRPSSAAPIFEVQVPITDVRDAGAGCVRLTVRAPEIAGFCQPGQFVMVKCAEGQDPLLPRPFTIYDADEGGDIALLVKRVGRGSNWLANRRPLDKLHVVGPLGHGFAIDSQLRLAVIIGGGTGVAALHMLTARLMSSRRTESGVQGDLADSVRVSGQTLAVLIGAHTRQDNVCLEDFLGLCGEQMVHPWETRVGLEEELERLSMLLKEGTYRPDEVQVFVAGPLDMMRRVAEFTRTRGIPCQLSIETRMACGVGVCQSCVCRTPDPGKYLLACADGPVFDSRVVML